jgi:hypothetical protein
MPLRRRLLLGVLGVLFWLGTALAVPNYRLTIDPGSSVRPRVALDPNNDVIVVWQDSRFGNNEILWQKFDQLGNPLTAVIRVTNTAGNSARPDVACDPAGNSHVVWQEGENGNGVGMVYFARLDGLGTKDLSGDPAVAAPFTSTTDVFFHRFAPTRRYNSAGAQTCERRFTPAPRLGMYPLYRVASEHLRVYSAAAREDQALGPIGAARLLGRALSVSLV